MRKQAVLGGLAAMMVSGLATASFGAIVNNPSFESPTVTGDTPGAPGWGQFNDAYTSVAAGGHTGTQALKVFGPFFNGGGAGVVQNVGAASAGQTWSASAYLKQIQGDYIGVNNFAIVKLEFLNASNSVIGAFESTHFDASSVKDAWDLRSVTGVAPANTASAQIVLVHVQLDPVDGGAVFYDDAAIGVVPEPVSIGAIGAAGLVLGRRRRA